MVTARVTSLPYAETTRLFASGSVSDARVSPQLFDLCSVEGQMISPSQADFLGGLFIAMVPIRGQLSGRHSHTLPPAVIGGSARQASTGDLAVVGQVRPTMASPDRKARKEPIAHGPPPLGDRIAGSTPIPLRGVVEQRPTRVALVDCGNPSGK